MHQEREVTKMAAGWVRLAWESTHEVLTQAW